MEEKKNQFKEKNWTVLLFLAVLIVVISIGIVNFKIAKKSRDRVNFMKLIRVTVTFTIILMNYYYYSFCIESKTVDNTIAKLSSFNGILGTCYFYLGYAMYGSVATFKLKMNEFLTNFFID